jgi:hypothetical protein
MRTPVKSTNPNLASISTFYGHSSLRLARCRKSSSPRPTGSRRHPSISWTTTSGRVRSPGSRRPEPVRLGQGEHLPAPMLFPPGALRCWRPSSRTERSALEEHLILREPARCLNRAPTPVSSRHVFHGGHDEDSRNASFGTSPRTTVTLRPMCLTAASSSACRRPMMKTYAPSATNRSAVARPMPLLPSALSPPLRSSKIEQTMPPRR